MIFMKYTFDLYNVPVITEQDIFRPGEDVYIQLSTQYPDFIGVIHKHTFIEIVYILSGSATHIIGDRSVPATKGDLFIINYDTPHTFVRDEDCDEPLIAYDLLFTPSFFDSSLLNSVFFESISSSFLFYSLFPEQQIASDVHISGSSYSAFGELFNKMYLEFTGRERGYINIIRAYMTELIVKIFRKMESTQNKEISSNQKHVVNSTLAYLRKNYQKQISLDELAAQVFLSKDYFSRLFRETTGMPTSAFLQKIRVEEACNLLTSTNIAIKDVAHQCGFHDIKYFYSIFKKLTGMTPRQYRLDSKKD